MAIPDYQSLMLPLLQLSSDKQDHSFREAVEVLAAGFRLTEEERKEHLSSGPQPKFENRLGWAMTYLAKAGVLERPGRGVFRITPRGLKFLKAHPDEINSGLLKEFSEYREFQNLSRTDDHPSETVSESSAYSPEEALSTSYLELQQRIGQDLLERVKAASPKFFERLVVELLVAMGYGGSRKDAGQTVGQSGDGGIDGIIKEDKLGLDNIYVQAKRWEAPVGRPVVQGFAGSLDGVRARKGVLITTSTFTPDAKQYVDRIEKKIVLVDGEQLALLMLEHGVGVTEVATYRVKRVDLDYFTEVG